MRGFGFVLICAVLLTTLAGCVNGLPPQASDPSLEEASVSEDAVPSVPSVSRTETAAAVPTEAPTAAVTAPVTTADPDGFPNVPDDGHSKLY